MERSTAARFEAKTAAYFWLQKARSSRAIVSTASCVDL